MTSWTQKVKPALAGLFVLLLFTVALLLLHSAKAPPKQRPAVETPVASSPEIDDAFWLHLDRRRVDKYREQLKSAPQVLVVRPSHYAFNPANGMGAHYGWIDGKMANLGISFRELVGYAYGELPARTEMPRRWTQGQMTNTFDVIVTIAEHPQQAMQAEARKLLREQFGLAWRRESRNTDVLLLRAMDKPLLERKSDVEFANSKSIPELARELENYFSKPVIDETGLSNRFDKTIGDVPARWINGRTTDLDANNRFLETVGLQLVAAKRPQEWLVMGRVH